MPADALPLLELPVPLLRGEYLRLREAKLATADHVLLQTGDQLAALLGKTRANQLAALPRSRPTQGCRSSLIVQPNMAPERAAQSNLHREQVEFLHTVEQHLSGASLRVLVFREPFMNGLAASRMEFHERSEVLCLTHPASSGRAVEGFNGVVVGCEY
ncbi:MAG: hypothetical protein IPH65_15870 [Dehalococcoidia bacterium]|uniref:hypothetical protein n=1 Tax=Candidatus Amarobacter glycogenicus TaxID=3140699 RepID=UPI00313663E2|nr:hypothetical protein [Dehalococcoidia bacterium]